MDERYREGEGDREGTGGGRNTSGSEREPLDACSVIPSANRLRTISMRGGNVRPTATVGPVVSIYGPPISSPCLLEGKIG